MTDHQRVAVRTDDDVELHLYHAEPDAPRGGPPLLLVPGMFSNRSFFIGKRQRGLARALAARGFDAWVGELQGPTRSAGHPDRRRWTFEDWIRRDAAALVGGVLAATGQSTLVWIGHSAGAVVGVAFLGSGHAHARHVGGLVMAGAPGPSLGPLRSLGAAAVLAVCAALGRFPARAIGLGPEDESSGILGQWMRWNLARRWTGADGTDYFAQLGRVSVPVLALAGGGDLFVAPPGSCRLLLERLGGTDRTLVTCGRAHGFRANYGHVGLIASPAAREEIWPLIGEWVERRFR